MEMNKRESDIQIWEKIKAMYHPGGGEWLGQRFVGQPTESLLLSSGKRKRSPDFTPFPKTKDFGTLPEKLPQYYLA